MIFCRAAAGTEDQQQCNEGNYFWSVREPAVAATLRSGWLEQECRRRMKTDVASTLPPLAAHPPSEGTQGMLLAAQPGIPIAPARPPLADKLISAAPMQDFDLARDLTLFARVLRRAEGGRRVVVIFVVSIACVSARGPDADRRGNYLIYLNSAGFGDRADSHTGTTAVRTAKTAARANAANRHSRRGPRQSRDRPDNRQSASTRGQPIRTVCQSAAGDPTEMSSFAYAKGWAT